MKRKKGETELQVVLNLFNLKCCKCLHIRRDEPYIKEIRWPTAFECRTKYTCWRCCRDAESTFLIKQKWPLAFDRGQKGQSWFLQWSPAVELMRGREHEAYFSS